MIEKRRSSGQERVHGATKVRHGTASDASTGGTMGFASSAACTVEQSDAEYSLAGFYTLDTTTRGTCDITKCRPAIMPTCLETIARRFYTGQQRRCNFDLGWFRTTSNGMVC